MGEVSCAGDARVVRGAECTAESEERGVKRIRSVLRWVKYGPDRFLHPIRRRVARRRVERATPRRILVLCHGNICRSPYAEHALRRRLQESIGPGILVASAGFIGAGRGSPDGAVRVAALRGVELSSHRSRLVTAPMLRDADLVFVMDVGQAAAARTLSGSHNVRVVLLGDLDPDPIDTRTILDPVERPDEAFVRSYARIDRCISEAVKMFVKRTG